MSKARQPRRVRPEPQLGRSIRSLALRLPGGHELPERAHTWAQLVLADRGYENASSFVSMFKRALGTTPGAYRKVTE